MSWPRFWQEKTLTTHLLRPLSWLTCRVARARRQRWEAAFMPTFPTAVVVVVGNVTVGGSGKTPLLQALVRQLHQAGIACGIVSRGYGGRPGSTPLIVRADTSPQEAGDEPVMLAQSLQVPVVVSPRRDEAVRTLLAHFPEVKVIFSDDGLQHYALPRDFEIAVVDGRRGFGNGLCLPAGPLREPVERLQDVDWRVVNGESERDRPLPVPMDARMMLVPRAFHTVKGDTQVSLNAFIDQPVCALAGIGAPERFFDTLRQLDVSLARTFSLPDHASLRQWEQALRQCDRPVLMTHKDAVKCRQLAPCRNAWYLAVEARLPDAFCQAFISAITQRLKEKYEN